MVSVVEFSSGDRSLIPSTVFSVNFVFEKNENKQKEAVVGPFLKKLNFRLE